MTGKEKIEAAFSKDGAPEIPVVVSYEQLFIRDHWQTFSCPWWYTGSPNIGQQIEYRHEVINAVNQDWMGIWQCDSKDKRKNIHIETKPEGVFKVDELTGRREQIYEPVAGGSVAGFGQAETERPVIPETKEDVDKMLNMPTKFSTEGVLSDGREDTALGLIRDFGSELFPIYHITSPLWACYSLWGFEGMLTLIATRPDLCEYACRKFLTQAIKEVRTAADLGIQGIWIEECMSDMISPESFAKLNLPFLQELTTEIRSNGLNSIYYYCGDPKGKLDTIIQAGADAISLEESKKNFLIDIEDIISAVKGKCAVLGNLDSINVLQNGTEEQLTIELKRQIAAGRRNESRFIVSLGSPVTPATPVSRVRLYCALTRELGKKLS